MYPFCNKARFHGEELLAPQPTSKLENHSSSAVRDCICNIFAAILHIGDCSPIRKLRARHTMVTDPPIMACVIKIKVFNDQPSDHQLLKRHIFYCSWLFGKSYALRFESKTTFTIKI